MAEKTSIEKQNYPLSVLEEDILTVLLGHQLYGLQISRAIEESSGGRRKIGVGSLYPTLRRIEKKGFVTSYWEGDTESERGGVRRRFYRITGTGAKVLAENQEVRKNLMEWQPV